MSEYKYTSDGRKVAVIGKLNAEQTIVQEVFVSMGQEFPSGENFVVSSLHDKPVESWREKNLRDLESRYEKEKARLESQLKQMRGRLDAATGKAKAQAEALMAFASKSDSSQLETLKRFMAGEITHLFVSGYCPEIVDWISCDGVYDFDRWGSGFKMDGIKLVSLYGNSDGSLEYRISDYRDGSGSWKTIYPASSYKQALELAQAECDRQAEAFISGDNGNFNLNEWVKIDGISVNNKAIEKFQEIKLKAKERRINELRLQIKQLEGDA